MRARQKGMIREQGDLHDLRNRHLSRAGGREPRGSVVADARHVVARWQGEKELVRKHFVWSDDRSTLKGIYFWTSRAAAEAAHSEEWLQQAEKRIGVRPTIDYFDAFMIVDNAAGTVTEYPPADAAVAAE
jgi:hypothetical protein